MAMLGWYNVNKHFRKHIQYPRCLLEKLADDKRKTANEQTRTKKSEEETEYPIKYVHHRQCLEETPWFKLGLE